MPKRADPADDAKWDTRTRPRQTCNRCGQALESLEVTVMGDREPSYIFNPCTCPGPRCPFCHARIGEPQAIVRADECPNAECFMFGHVIPQPEVAIDERSGA